MQVEIVTPEAILFQGEADMVISRGTTGEFGVMADHEPMVVSLGYGELRLYTGDSISSRYAVFGGFLEVRENVVSVLTDDAVPGDAIDGAEAEAALHEAQAAVTGRDRPSDAATGALARAEVLAGVAESAAA